MKDEINLVKVLEIILKLWWVVLIFALVMAFAAYSISTFLMTTKYKSEAKVYVSGSQMVSDRGINASDINTSKLLVNTYIEILQGNAFLSSVADEFNRTNDEGWEITAGQLKSGLTMSSANETEVLSITYDDISPEKAQKVLNELLANAQDEITRVLNGCKVSVIDKASLPTSVSSPNTKQNTFIGMFLGIVLGIAIIFIKELLDTRIKDDEELKTRYDIAVLGIIPNLDVE